MSLAQGLHVSIALTAYATVLKAQVETIGLPAPPRTVMQPHDMHMPITDHIAIHEYQFEVLHLDKTSLLIWDGRLPKLRFLTVVDSATPRRACPLPAIWV